MPEWNVKIPSCDRLIKWCIQVACDCRHMEALGPHGLQATATLPLISQSLEPRTAGGLSSYGSCSGSMQHTSSTSRRGPSSASTSSECAPTPCAQIHMLPCKVDCRITRLSMSCLEASISLKHSPSSPTLDDACASLIKGGCAILEGTASGLTLPWRICAAPLAACIACLTLEALYRQPPADCSAYRLCWLLLVLRAGKQHGCRMYVVRLCASRTKQRFWPAMWLSQTADLSRFFPSLQASWPPCHKRCRMALQQRPDAKCSVVVTMQVPAVSSEPQEKADLRSLHSKLRQGPLIAIWSHMARRILHEYWSTW